MNIAPRSVDGNVNIYLLKGFQHFWNHQTIYLIPAIVLMLFVGISGLSNRLIESFMIMAFGLYFAFLYMEITFVSAREKYSPHSYFRSYVIALVGLVNFIRDKGVFLYVVVYGTVAILGEVLTMYAIGKDVLSFNSFSNEFFMKSITSLSGTKVLFDFIFLTFILSKLPSDHFVVSRMTGFNSSIPDSVCEGAINMNSKIMMKFAIIGFIFTVFSPFMFGFQGILLAILIASLTFYSMDVFGVEQGLLQKQEETVKANEVVPEIIN